MSTFNLSSSLVNSSLVRRNSSHEDVNWMNGANKTKKAKALSTPSIFGNRIYKKCPDLDRYRIRRRKAGGKSIALPPTIVGLFTEGERAVLNVIANVVKERGYCDWYVDKIRRVAGVSRRTVQYTVKKASQLGILCRQMRPVRKQKNLSNVIRIRDAAWKDWLQTFKTTFFMARGCKSLHPIGDKNNKYSQSKPNGKSQLQGSLKGPMNRL